MLIHFKNIIQGFAAFYLSCIFLFGCVNDPNEVKSLGTKKTGIEEAKQVTLTYTLTGNTKAILTSPLMYNVQDVVPYVEFPKTLHADFYNDLGKIESKMDAKYAKYEQYKSIVFLRDSVVVINIEKGDTLICDELYWDRNRYGTEFYTEKPVKIRTKNETINGTGMEASQDFKNWHILHSVGVISVPASSFPK
jgi:hypothetical protein